MPTPLDISYAINTLYIAAQTELNLLDAENIQVEQADCDAMFASLVELMPPGDIWVRDENSEIGKLLKGCSIEMCRVVKAIDIALEREADPRTCVYMLPEWQRVVKLKDTFDPDWKVRRDAVVELLRYRVGTNRAHWLALVQGLGFTNVSIVDPKDPFRIGDEMGGEMKGGPWHYAMEIQCEGGTDEARETLQDAVLARLHATWAAVFTYND